MKCPNCGSEVKGKVCKYCNSELPYDENALARDNFFTEFFYIVDCVLFPPAKFMFILWTLCWISTIIPDTTYTVLQKITTILFGYIPICGIADLIYMGKTMRYKAYKLKIIEKKKTRIQKTINKYFPYKALLDEANTLATVVNTTTDEYTFETSYNRLIDIFRELKKYERTGVFTNSPTEDLNNLYFQRDAATKKFYQRRNSSIKPTVGQVQQYIPTQSKLSFDNMEGHDFEYFCADVLKKNHFSNVEVTQGSGDQGVDIIATKDGIKYAIQCKCYSQNIGNKAVQEVFAGKTFYNCHVAAVLTNQYFTSSAQALAESNGVLLWDRDKLEEMIKNMN